VSFLSAALQLEIDRDPAEEVEPAAHPGNKQILTGGQLIDDRQVEVHARPSAQEAEEQNSYRFETTK
jgi:hypothetical protein